MDFEFAYISTASGECKLCVSSLDRETGYSGMAQAGAS
jgi:hypothetical protein